jgi:tetratricopeptide (TPR) repeat protein
MLLVVVTFALYSPVHTHDFINYDDDVYVYKNTNVTDGLNWHTVRWALTSTEQANWHPVTWLSHALDCQLFGLDPGPHHLVNVVIHAGNVLLLFLLLQQVTGAMGRSWMVAALFAWHPFNVQSVAWVAERKNVLSTLFFLLALGAYGWYARKPQLKRFLLVMAFFLLALASKPMAVSLPFVLLLLDYWPLRRVAGWSEAAAGFVFPQQSPLRLLLEKLPLFAVSAASCVVTVWAQRTGGAVRSLQRFPIGARIGNALNSYVVYIYKTFWPSGFALNYPHPGNSGPLWQPILAAALLCAISAAAWNQRRIRPYFLVGWLWFLGTLVPVIGVVQVGDQAMADRYAYLPLMGLFVMTVWGAAEFARSREIGLSSRLGLAFVVLTVLSFLTFQQIPYWENSLTIWSRTLQVTNENLSAERGLATALAVDNNIEEAIPHLLKVARLDPTDISTIVNIGAYYAAQGRLEDAAQEFETAIRSTDHGNLNTKDEGYRASALLNLGFVYAQSYDFPKALLNLEKAARSDSTMVDHTTQALEKSLATQPSEGNCLKLSLLLRARGNENEAVSALKDAVKSHPEYTHVADLLNYLSTASTYSNLADPSQFKQR